MYVEPEQNHFNFTPGNEIAKLAKKNDQLLRCHTLVWHNQLADWVTAKKWTKSQLKDLLVKHVTKEVTHWRGKCYAWDVVNEALNEDGTYRSDVFYDILGEEYFKIAFATAHKADPHAKLYYNDYNIEMPGPKSDGVIRLVKMLKKAGVKIDGVGLQAHFVVGDTPTIDEQIANMKSFTKLGVDVAQTELDIRLWLPANRTNLAQQSKDYEKSVGACMQVKGCVGTTVWDFYDPVSQISIAATARETHQLTCDRILGSTLGLWATEMPLSGLMTGPSILPTTEL